MPVRGVNIHYDVCDLLKAFAAGSKCKANNERERERERESDRQTEREYINIRKVPYMRTMLADGLVQS